MKEQSFFSRLNSCPELKTELINVKLADNSMYTGIFESAKHSSTRQHQHFPATMTLYINDTESHTICVNDIVSMQLVNELECHVQTHKSWGKGTRNKSYWIESMSIPQNQKLTKTANKNWQAPAMPRRFVKSLSKN